MGMLNSVGKKVRPTADYTCTDVAIQNENGRIFSFCTPVCSECLPAVCHDKRTWDNLKLKIMTAAINESFVPPNFWKTKTKVIYVGDLTSDLVENNVI